jgi:hypothetical protein
MAQLPSAGVVEPEINRYSAEIDRRWIVYPEYIVWAKSTIKYTILLRTHVRLSCRLSTMNTKIGLTTYSSFPSPSPSPPLLIFPPLPPITRCIPAPHPHQPIPLSSHFRPHPHTHPHPPTSRPLKLSLHVGIHTAATRLAPVRVGGERNSGQVERPFPYPVLVGERRRPELARVG